MLHLIKLEMKKHKPGGMLLTVLISDLAILAFVLMIGYSEPFEDYATALYVIRLLVTSTFVVYASVLLSKFVVEEYRSQTITLLFLYPINRRKLLLSKLLIVGAFTFLAIVISDLTLSAGFAAINDRRPIVPEGLTADLLADEAVRLLIFAASAACLSLIPLFFGMRKKSVPVTIVSSLLIVFIFFLGGPQLSSAIGVPVALGIVGLLAAYLTVRNVETKDL